jgi:hypothetical protein
MPVPAPSVPAPPTCTPRPPRICHGKDTPKETFPGNPPARYHLPMARLPSSVQGVRRLLMLPRAAATGRGARDVPVLRDIAHAPIPQPPGLAPETKTGNKRQQKATRVHRQSLRSPDRSRPSPHPTARASKATISTSRPPIHRPPSTAIARTMLSSGNHPAPCTEGHQSLPPIRHSLPRNHRMRNAITRQPPCPVHGRPPISTSPPGCPAAPSAHAPCYHQATTPPRARKATNLYLPPTDPSPPAPAPTNNPHHPIPRSPRPPPRVPKATNLYLPSGMAPPHNHRIRDAITRQPPRPCPPPRPPYSVN